jgi:hypothetical protein
MAPCAILLAHAGNKVAGLACALQVTAATWAILASCDPRAIDAGLPTI